MSFYYLFYSSVTRAGLHRAALAQGTMPSPHADEDDMGITRARACLGGSAAAQLFYDAFYFS